MSGFDAARLVLEDGSELRGQPFGASEAIAGEVVFTTGMVGYPEALTDPSYRGQILVCTYPLVGNYGVPGDELDDLGLPRYFESERIQAAGLVITDLCKQPSHHSSTRTLDEWLHGQGIPGLAGVDTRALTKLLRDKGSMLGKLIAGPGEPTFVDPNARNLAVEVCCTEPQDYRVDETGPTVVLIDCGVKANIIRSLLRRGINVRRVPHDHYFLNDTFDGIVISNGPGDPQTLTTTVNHIKHALALSVPIFGICMGIQVLSLAIGASTYKLKFGHRSHNQPCRDLLGDESGTIGTRCYLTSQNHGYAVRRDSLPDDWQVWFENANDQTVAGIRHHSRPLSAVQFHPEATPGPNDTNWLFDRFETQLREGRET